MSPRPSYFRVFATFARNSLVRDMTFRWNFIIQCVSSMSWILMNLGFYLLIFHEIGKGSELAAHSGWRQYEFFVFLSTTLFVNSLVQTFFMPNAEEFSELIRTGGLDFALLKPIDTQFLISLQRVNWASLANFGFGAGLLAFSLWKLQYRPPLSACLLYPLYIVCGVVIMYSLMISLASTSIWLGRNTTLYNFWFYLTNFSRYPMEIYDDRTPTGGGGRLGYPLMLFFTYVVPILVVVNVPARLLAKPMQPQEWPLAVFALAATVSTLLIARWIFTRALLSYRSASS